MIAILSATYTLYLHALVAQRVDNATHCIKVFVSKTNTGYTLLLFYYQELSMLSSNQDLGSEEIPSPYVSLPRLTALVRYSKKADEMVCCSMFLG